MTELPRVTIYTDGGADPNPGPGGWGAVLIDRKTGQVKEFFGSEDETTNNRMELCAGIRALEALKTRCSVDLFTDSQYLRRGVTEWLDEWIDRGFRRKGGELRNADLWQRLAELVREHEIEWHWVKGHAGDRWNERADELAGLGVRQAGQARAGASVDTNSASGTVVVLKVVCPQDRPGGWAAKVFENGEERELTGALPKGSANKLDILAATALVKHFPQDMPLVIYAGSDYLRNGATQWISGWRQRGWKTKSDQPVKNREAWEELDELLTSRRVTWPKVGEEQREILKHLAKVARREFAQK